MDFIDDDENVKAMRDTAQIVGLTALLKDTRRELVEALTVLDRQRARVTKALMLLGVHDRGQKSGDQI
jgi:hypothetical protein